MEPWEAEEQRQLRWQRRISRLPKCVCCGDPILTEKYLDLTAFGLKDYACEECLDANTGYSEYLLDDYPD